MAPEDYIKMRKALDRASSTLVGKPTAGHLELGELHEKVRKTRRLPASPTVVVYAASLSGYFDVSDERMELYVNSDKYYLLLLGYSGISIGEVELGELVNLGLAVPFDTLEALVSYALMH